MLLNHSKLQNINKRLENHHGNLVFFVGSTPTISSAYASWSMTGPGSKTVTGVDPSKIYYVVMCEYGGGLVNNVNITGATIISDSHSLNDGIDRFIILQPNSTSFTVSVSLSTGRVFHTSVWLAE